MLENILAVNPLTLTKHLELLGLDYSSEINKKEFQFTRVIGFLNDILLMMKIKMGPKTEHDFIIKCLFQAECYRHLFAKFM